MAREPRQYQSGLFYEVVFRARTNLPLPPNRTIKRLMKSALARTQRDDKVDICHYLAMSNHLHFGVVVRDAAQMAKFLMELEKKLTDAIKRLLDISYLNLWEGRPKVIAILDVDQAIKSISYWYANPANSNLTETITDYPGLSSWEAFTQCGDTLEASFSEDVEWIRLNHIKALRSPRMTEREDIEYDERLRKSAKQKHSLVIKPNLWMKSFGIERPRDIAAINESIRRATRVREEEMRRKRVREGKSVLGALKLAQTPIMKAHTPKKNERRIFVLSTDKELRIAFIREAKANVARYRELYETRWRKGDLTVQWPLGMFPPPPPLMSNRLADPLGAF